MPPLSNAVVAEVAGKFLQSKIPDPQFHARAQTRVRPYGCRYTYEEAEQLDSLGGVYIVVVNRQREVVNFFGSD